MPRKTSGPTQIFQIKITLQDSRPPIWRRIQVRSDDTLAQLHEILQVVMGWTDSHLHQFAVGNVYYGVPHEEGIFGLQETRNERRHKLSDVIPREKFRFRYDYDFGDGWEHVLLVEKILPPKDGARYPICLAGAGAGPPEDVGGIWGYYEFLEALRNPEHERHEEMREWIGSKFDPQEFDVNRVNLELEAMRESTGRRSRGYWVRSREL